MKRFITPILLFFISNICFANDIITEEDNRETNDIQTVLNQKDQDTSDDNDVFSVLKEKRKTYAPNKGFKTYVSVGLGPKFGIDKKDKISLGVTIGRQFNHYFYLGLGMGYYGMFKNEFFNDAQLFLNTRITFNSRVSPFFDFKVGYKAFYSQVPYFSPSAGIRIGVTKDFGVNLCVSYENIQTKDYFDESFYNYHNYYPKFWERGLFFKVEFDM